MNFSFMFHSSALFLQYHPCLGFLGLGFTFTNQIPALPSSCTPAEETHGFIFALKCGFCVRRRVAKLSFAGGATRRCGASTAGDDSEEIYRRETFSPKPEDDVDPIWFVLTDRFPIIPEERIISLRSTNKRRQADRFIFSTFAAVMLFLFNF